MIFTAVLWFSAIGCLLMAGLYFAFSVFIMTALARIGRAGGVAAMNEINAVILRSLFMPLFLGTTLTALALVALALLDLDRPGAMSALAGGISYVIGMFAVTMLFNVPLNNRLAASDPTGSSGNSVWDDYLKRWTAWNHVRTIASTAAGTLFISAIAAG